MKNTNTIIFASYNFLSTGINNTTLIIKHNSGQTFVKIGNFIIFTSYNYSTSGVDKPIFSIFRVA